MVEGQSPSDGVGMRDNRHKLECREFPLEIRKSFFFTMKVVQTGTGSPGRFKPELGMTRSDLPQLALL